MKARFLPPLRVLRSPPAIPLHFCFANAPFVARGTLEGDDVRCRYVAAVLAAAIGLSAGCRRGPLEPTDAPQQLSPDDGEVFDNMPREVTLSWTSTSSQSYFLEVQVCQPPACSDSTATPLVVPREHLRTSYTLLFVGPYPGRWRVSGEGTRTSPWRTFYFTR
jgi:hypothetical protein